MPDKMIMIKNARVSYPHLFTAPVINGEPGKCGAVILMDEANPAVAELKAEIVGLIQSKLQGKKLPPDRICLRAPEQHQRDEYGDMLALSSNCKAGKTPLVVGLDGRTRVADESQSAIYPGCRVHAKVRLWAQDNKYGKRINSELIAIQFAGDDEPLDDTHVSEDEAIDGFEGSEPFGGDTSTAPEPAESLIDF